MQHLPTLLMIGLLLFLSGCSDPEPPTMNLYRAVHIEDIDQVERNLFWKADVDQLGADGLAPLHVASRLGSLVIIEMLLKHGADIETKSRDGHTPVATATLSRNTLAAEYLLKKGATLEANPLLQEAVREGLADRDVVDFLVKQGADLNLLNDQGNAPLHTAILNSRRVIAKYLVQKGADIDLPNASGHTPLQLALSSGERDIEKMLRKFGAVGN